jgi:hypothetical protein
MIILRGQSVGSNSTAGRKHLLHDTSHNTSRQTGYEFISFCNLNRIREYTALGIRCVGKTTGEHRFGADMLQKLAA